MNMNRGHGIQLPEWIFDIDDEDEISEDKSILQELEIDPSLIYRYNFYVDTSQSMSYFINTLSLPQGISSGFSAVHLSALRNRKTATHFKRRLIEILIFGVCS